MPILDHICVFSCTTHVYLERLNFVIRVGLYVKITVKKLLALTFCKFQTCFQNKSYLPLSKSYLPPCYLPPLKNYLPP